MNSRRIVPSLLRSAAVVSALFVLTVAPAVAGATPASASAANATPSSNGPTGSSCIFGCAPSIQATWNQAARTVTVQGSNFTSGGTVAITYNWGGGTYRQYAIASRPFSWCGRWTCYWVPGGSFSVTEPIPCGPIPGQNGIGVYVDAYDYGTGYDPMQGVATPC